MKRRALLGIVGASMGGLAGCLGETEYTVTNRGVEQRDGPLQLDVAVLDQAVTIDSPAHLELSLRNTSKQEVRIRNTGIWPFGVLGLAPSRDAKPIKSSLVWSEKYLTSDRVDLAKNGSGGGVDGNPIIRSLGPKSAITARYQIHGDLIHRTGTTYLRGYFAVPILAYSTASDDWTQYRPEIDIAINARGIFSKF